MSVSHSFLEEDLSGLGHPPHDPKDPDPWLALYLDTSFPMDEGVKAALIADMRSRSRQFLLPFLRPLARCFIVLIQILKTLLPRAFAASKLMHWLNAKGLTYFVTPEGNYLILRHFHVGGEISGLRSC